MRVVHAPAAVGGHPPGLVRAERALGLDSVLFTLDRPPFGYDADRVLAPAGTSPLMRELRRWNAVRDVLRSADVVHFNFGSTLAPSDYGTGVRTGIAGRAFARYARATEQLDLRLLARGRPVFVTFQGDDVRPEGSPEADAAKARRAARFGRFASKLYALNPDLLRHLPPEAEFLPYASADLEAWAPVGTTADGPMRVAHAPTDRAKKGTNALLATIERLRHEGVDVELVLIEGMTRAEARLEYERADLLVDQLLLGWYGGVAVEAMALAKPVVANLDPDQLATIPSAMSSELPVVDADPRTLEQVLRELATTRRSELPELGRRGRAYVERWHDPQKIARRVVGDYEVALARRRQPAAD